ncbi:MAG: cytochrome c oxidase accessory protein CcoG [Colwellia sp.]|nr:MAG: cytochrome c oxidase accessory protein CcoG [Colwellia sp.]
MKYNFKEEQLIIKPYKSEQSIYIREQKGVYQTYRRLLSWLLIIMFITIPFLQYQGQQAVLFDIGKQQFRVFSLTFWPQDFVLLAGILTLAAFALFFVTTWLGRVWCGYVCPQTIWTLAYVWVEHRIEGKRNQRKALDKAPWNLNKLKKKTLKHSLWLSMSFLTATTFISYFIPVQSLYTDLLSFDSTGLITFWVLFFTLCTYSNAGWLREKVCIDMCPYARFQSAMFDKNTLLVAYDAQRGENRGARKLKDDAQQLKQEQGLGDCVDCNLCVEVCPTGIDIRNGMQYECINCALCIDTCDETMARFNYKKGLISYTSEQALTGGKSKRFNVKLIAYASFCLVCSIAMILWINARIPLEASVLRDRNGLYSVNYQGMIKNTYTLKILNKSQQPLHFKIKIPELETITLKLPQKLLIKPGAMQTVPLTLIIDRNKLDNKMTNINFIIQAIEQPRILLKRKSIFFRD